MTLNKKTIKSVCSHMSQSRPRWETGPWPPSALGESNSAFAPDVRALQNPNLEGEEVAQNGLETQHDVKQFLKRPGPLPGCCAH